MAKLIVVVALAIAFGGVFSGCARQSYEGTDMGDAFGSGYWSELAGGVGKTIK